jgi:hypothetical protein
VLSASDSTIQSLRFIAVACRGVLSWHDSVFLLPPLFLFSFMAPSCSHSKPGKDIREALRAGTRDPRTASERAYLGKVLVARAAERHGSRSPRGRHRDRPQPRMGRSERFDARQPSGIPRGRSTSRSRQPERYENSRASQDTSQQVTVTITMARATTARSPRRRFAADRVRAVQDQSDTVLAPGHPRDSTRLGIATHLVNLLMTRGRPRTTTGGHLLVV